MSKLSPYWLVKDVNETMLALSNPMGSSGDVMVTLRYTGGSGIYHSF